MSISRAERHKALDYPVEIRVIPGELGGGYSACIPCLGRWTFFADGETPEEALAHLEEVRVALFEDMVERGKEIPAPPPLPEEQDEEYSGKLLLRLPRDLHREVAEMAAANNSSVNQYIATALARHVGVGCQPRLITDGEAALRNPSGWMTWSVKGPKVKDALLGDSVLAAYAAFFGETVTPHREAEVA